jgi:hypothetical protein
MDADESPTLFSADLSGCAAPPVLAGDEVADLYIDAIGRTFDARPVSMQEIPRDAGRALRHKS